jgi:thiamine biosynthesis lipoprotein
MVSEMEDHLNHPAPVPASPEDTFVVPEGMSQTQFHAMGTTVTLLLPQERHREGLAAVTALFSAWERTLSRFKPDSELSQLNQRAGQTVIVSERLFKVLLEALTAAQATNGTYDPTLLDQLVQIGYDRTFDEVSPIQPQTTYTGQAGGAWRSIVVDPATHSVTLPAAIHLDFGGIAKGMAVDAALTRLQHMGITNALVNAGGDLAVCGLPPHADHWSIAIPGKGCSWAIPLQHGAIATSGIAKRHWQQGDTQRHHLLDPRTGLPASTTLWSVSVVSGRCVEAEIAAKVAFILDRQEGQPFLAQLHLAGFFVYSDGNWETGAYWPEQYMRRLL